MPHDPRPSLLPVAALCQSRCPFGKSTWRLDNAWPSIRLMGATPLREHCASFRGGSPTATGHHHTASIRCTHWSLWIHTFHPQWCGWTGGHPGSPRDTYPDTADIRRQIPPHFSPARVDFFHADDASIADRAAQVQHIPGLREWDNLAVHRFLRLRIQIVYHRQGAGGPFRSTELAHLILDVRTKAKGLHICTFGGGSCATYGRTPRPLGGRSDSCPIGYTSSSPVT